MRYNSVPDENLFCRPPTATQEVKELAVWNAAKILKQFGGKAAPEFSWTDLDGKQVRFADLKGKTVLLDFWTTWCPPSRADGSALDKLFEKYRDKGLAIVGISVNEDRAVVQKFLAEHPHPFPIMLTTENELPRAYRIGLFPTYLVIDPAGILTFATEGDKGYSELRKMMKKAGLEAD